MLRVGGVGVNCDRAVAQQLDTFGKASRLLMQSARCFFAQALRTQAPYAVAHEDIREITSLGQSQEAGGGSLLGQLVNIGNSNIQDSILFGNQGISIDVLR
jgi:hypothetical protein